MIPTMPQQQTQMPVEATTEEIIRQRIMQEILNNQEH